MLSDKKRVLIFLLFAGIIYAIIVRYTSFCIPCFFQTITGLRCPGCGITHVFLYLMDLNPVNAFFSNMYLFATAPVLLLIMVLNFFCSPDIRKKPFTKWLTIVYAISLLVWAVVRNIINM